MSRSPSPSPRGPARRRSALVHASPPLDALAKRFTSFRQHHGRGARVPQELREAALSALEQGVAPSDLFRACGLSWGQVAAWRARRADAPRSPAEHPDVRVFTVTDDLSARDAHGPELELRLGRWSVCVRLAEPNRTGRS